MQMDNEACKIIKRRIEEDKMATELQHMWHHQNRKELRAKLIRRHEKNIALEQKSGIKKEYATLR